LLFIHHLDLSSNYVELFGWKLGISICTRIEENLTPIDDEEVFCQMIGECYSETKSGGA
jgi:hypothetical protein